MISIRFPKPTVPKLTVPKLLVPLTVALVSLWLQPVNAQQHSALVFLPQNQDSVLARWVDNGACLTEPEFQASLTDTTTVRFSYSSNTVSHCVHTVVETYHPKPTSEQPLSSAYEALLAKLSAQYGTPETEEVMDLLMGYRHKWTLPETRVMLSYSPGNAKLEVEYHRRKIR